MTTTLINLHDIDSNLSTRNFRPLGEREKVKGIIDGENAVFPISVSELRNEFGEPTGIYGIANALNGRHVGQYQNQETVIANEDLLAELRTAFNALGISYSLKIQAFNFGSRIRFTFRLEQGDSFNGFPINSELVVENSYDGKLKLKAFMGMLLLACLNGMERVSKEFALLKRHSKTLDIKMVRDGIEKALNARPDASKLFSPMLAMPVNNDSVTAILGRFTGDKFPKNVAMQTLLNWHSPDEPEKQYGDNYWRLFNAGTRALRDYASVRPEKARAINAHWTQVGIALGQDASGQASGFLRGTWETYRKPFDGNPLFIQN